jgi:hypothetical protein
MTTVLFIELVAKVGLPAAEFLYARYVKKDEILTADDLETLRTLAAYTSHEALEQAGIKIVNGQVVHL